MAAPPRADSNGGTDRVAVGRQGARAPALPPSLLGPLPAPPRRDPSLMPFLSIMLLVLAFFIILTSKASFDADKARAVTESVQRKFAGQQAAVVDGPQGGALQPEARDVLENVRVLFQGLVPLDRNARQIGAHEMALSLPVDLFFAADTAEVLPARRSLMDEVMRAIALRPAGWGYELEIRLQGDPPGPLTLDRAANLAATLAGERPAEPGILVALGPGSPDWMALMIRLRPTPGESLP